MLCSVQTCRTKTREQQLSPSCTISSLRTKPG